MADSSSSSSSTPENSRLVCRLTRLVLGLGLELGWYVGSHALCARASILVLVRAEYAIGSEDCRGMRGDRREWREMRA